MNDRRPHRPSSPAAPEGQTQQRGPGRAVRGDAVKNADPSARAGHKRAEGKRAAEGKRVNDDGTATVVGIGAARAVLNARPEDVVGIAYCAEARNGLAELLRAAARHRIAYREVPRDELARMADTIHHEGISLRVRPRRAFALADVLRKLPARGFVLALDSVDNPHNVGALLRSAAYFGASGLLLEGDRETLLSPAATRIAEGGAETVPVCVVPRLADALTTLKAAGLAVVGADAHAGAPIVNFDFPARIVLVLGSERHGLSPAVKQRCTHHVRIEGTNAVESLNVSVAAGILMASAYAAIARTP